MAQEEIKVSIFCTAYNHEKYIRKCLDSFLSQKTTFRYEVLVHDDASTDSTADIIREYERSYPEIIKPIYQEQNQYSQHVRISKTILMPRAKGQYFAWCEGDDFWSDPYKLQKQVDAMERFSDCHLCMHTVGKIGENGEPLDSTIPINPPETGMLTTRQILEIVAKAYSFQTSSHFVRAEDYRNYWNQNLEFREIADVGDEPLVMYFSQLGGTYYFTEVMSQYRVGSEGSWGNRITGEKRRDHQRKMVLSYQAYDQFTNHQYSDLCNACIFLHLFPIIQYDCQYRLLLEPQYSEYYKKLPIKYKICARLDAMFPQVFEGLLKTRRKRQDAANAVRR